MKYFIDFHTIPAAFFYVIGRKNIGFPAVMAHKAGIETVLVSCQACGPLPFPISIPVVFQPVYFVIFQHIKNIGNDFPVA